MSKIAIVGFGVVGLGVYEAIEKKKEQIRTRCGEDIEVKYILDVLDFPGTPYEEKVIHDFSLIEKDPEVGIIVETIGGAGAAYEFTKRALSARKSVVTSNKELVATHGKELLELAREHGARYLYEGSVGGGIPVIRPMENCLAANDIREIYGILNGTTNFILAKMIKEGKILEEALKDAQALGYAERDPSADLDGPDAVRKICILASIASGRHIKPEQVWCEGMRGITVEDIAFADRADMVIKFLGRCVKKGDGMVVYVAPHLIPKHRPLACVDGVFNGITVVGDEVDELMFYGRGAGAAPTASAVMGDIVDILENPDRRGRLWEDGSRYVEDCRVLENRWYVRMTGDLRTAEEIFGEFTAIIQSGGEVVFITAKMDGYSFEQRIKILKEFSIVNSSFRILD